MNSLYKNETWSLATLLPKQKVVSCKWIFKNKLRKVDEGEVKYKTSWLLEGTLKGKV